MSEDWVGCRVSLDCSGLGFFQGVICRINLGDQTVTIEKPFQNGVPCKFPEITLNATDIQDLKILKSKAEIDRENSSVVGTGSSSVVRQEKKKSKQRESDGQQKNRDTDRHDTVSGKSQPQPLMSKTALPHQVHSSVNRQSPRFNNARASPRKGYEDNNRGRTYSECGARTPNRAERNRQRDDDCFGQVGNALSEEEKRLVEEEFDFEKNLAMFDKQTVMAEIDAEFANKPDIVRLVHCNKRQPEPKYRNDENVLEGVAVEYRQITTGEETGVEFITDLGLVVPSVSHQLKDRLQAVIVNHGLSLERQAEVMGRAATELAIQLLGGQHRLSPTNMHQVPTAVFLCGTSQVATFGIAAARHLAGHGAKTQVYLPDAGHYPHVLETELRLYRLTGGKVVTRGKDLPNINSQTVDLIVMAMEDQEMWSQERCQPWHRAAIAWAESSKAPVLAIDPPPHPPALPVKMTLVGGLPLAHPQEAGKLYLANLGIPKNVYKEVGIKFNSPFGAKFVIPLHGNGKI